MRDRSEKRAPIGSPSRHSSSPRTVLLRAGFQNAARAGALLGDPALLPFLPAHAEADDVGEVGDPDGRASADRSKRPGSRPADVRLGPAREDLVSSLALTADPDMALLSLVRLAEAAVDSPGIGGQCRARVHDDTGSTSAQHPERSGRRAP